MNKEQLIHDLAEFHVQAGRPTMYRLLVVVLFLPAMIAAMVTWPLTIPIGVLIYITGGGYLSLGIMIWPLLLLEKLDDAGRGVKA